MTINNLLPETWNNLIAYPDFTCFWKKGDVVNEHSIFWRVEANHSFFALESGNLKSDNKKKSETQLKDKNQVPSGLRINNYYHEPIAIRNGLWGSRIFLKKTQQYSIGLTYNSNIRLYMGLYRNDTNVPLKLWVLEPTNGFLNWQDNFWADNFLKKNSFNCDPLYLKITIPDTCGEFIYLEKLFLTESCFNPDMDSSNFIPSALPYSNLNNSYSAYNHCNFQCENLPEIAVGIVTFNRKAHIQSLLAQVQNINYPANKIAVFVVDNASSDGTSEMLKQEFPNVIILKNQTNLGGSGGFNRFFKYLAAMENPPEFGWLIDDDAVIEENTLIHLVRTLAEDKSIAIAGSVMMDLENPAMVYETGGDLFKDKFGWKANIIHAELNEMKHMKEKSLEVGYAGAYSLLFRTNVIYKAGIWKDYFLHVDDSEWCLRVQKITGQKVVIALDSLIWHVLIGSKKPFTVLRYYETRNFLDYFAGTGNKKTLLKILFQTILMGAKQLSIKRYDLCQFHEKGINDFINAKFGKQELKRSAVMLPDIRSVLNYYKKEKNKYPNKLYIVKEINPYMNDGNDYESAIIKDIRTISNATRVIETSMENKDAAIRMGDSFKSIRPSPIKIVLFVKMLKSICFPSKGIVVLPFWNESIIPNNLAEFTAVFEDKQFSLYRTQRLKLIVQMVKLFFRSSFAAIKIVKGDINEKAAHVKYKKNKRTI